MLFFSGLSFSLEKPPIPLNFEVIQTTMNRLKAHKQFVLWVRESEMEWKKDLNHHHKKSLHYSSEIPSVCVSLSLSTCFGVYIYA